MIKVYPYTDRYGINEGRKKYIHIDGVAYQRYDIPKLLSAIDEMFTRNCLEQEKLIPFNYWKAAEHLGQVATYNELNFNLWLVCFFLPACVHKSYDSVRELYFYQVLKNQNVAAKHLKWMDKQIFVIENRSSYITTPSEDIKSGFKTYNSIVWNMFPLACEKENIELLLSGGYVPLDETIIKLGFMSYNSSQTSLLMLVLMMYGRKSVDIINSHMKIALCFALLSNDISMTYDMAFFLFEKYIRNIFYAYVDDIENGYPGNSLVNVYNLMETSTYLYNSIYNNPDLITEPIDSVYYKEDRFGGGLMKSQRKLNIKDRKCYEMETDYMIFKLSFPLSNFK